MPSVENKPIMLNAIMLSVIMLSVIILSVVGTDRLRSKPLAVTNTLAYNTVPKLASLQLVLTSLNLS